MIQLTALDNMRHTREVLINPDHVVSVKPRRGFQPDLTSQAGGVKTVDSGTEVVVSTGEHYNVTEPFAQVAEMVGQGRIKTPPPTPAPPPQVLTQYGPQDVHVPAKKAAPKKAAPVGGKEDKAAEMEAEMDRLKTEEIDED